MSALHSPTLNSQSVQSGSVPRALVMAGGTGGHVFPGLAVAHALRDRGWQVHWLGNPQAMEGRLVPQHGFALEALSFGGLRGKGLMTTLKLPFNLLRACWQALSIVRRFRPNIVLGLGGYITFPGGLVSKLTGCPLVLHEQNSVAGLANRALAKIATRTLQAFPNALVGAQWVGNPLRKDMLSIAAPEQRYAARSGPLRILVVGGSLGAQALNQVMPHAFAAMPQAQRPFVRHQTGRGAQAQVNSAYVNLVGQLPDSQLNVSEFIDDMAAAYADADIVLCRAGAMTVSELAAVGVASILVPFPHAVDDHQTANAKFLVDAKAGLLMPQSDLNQDSLSSLLMRLTRQDCLSMAVRASALAKRDATETVVEVCDVVRRKDKEL